MTDNEILSPEDLLAASDFDWHEVEILGSRSRQRPLEVAEWIRIRSRCPDLAHLVGEWLSPEAEDAAENASDASLLSQVGSFLTDSLVGVTKGTAAYIVACSLGRGDDDEYIAALTNRPERFLAAGLSNVLRISFAEGGVQGFFTKTFGEMIETAQMAGLTPKGIQKLILGMQIAMASDDEFEAATSTTPA